MTEQDNFRCRLAARCQRLLEAQALAETAGDVDGLRAANDALELTKKSVFALDAVDEMHKNIAMHNEIDRVVAALIPGETDEEMAITRCRNIWHVAHAEAIRAEVVFKDVAAERSRDRSNEVLVRYVNAMRDLSHALLWMAAAETDVNLAALPPAEAADLQARLEEFETLEG